MIIPGQPARPRPAAERVLKSIQIIDMGYDTPCWISPKAENGRGYVKVGTTQDGAHHFEYAHRVVWEAVYGPIPQELELDHECGVPRCCSPGHTHPVSSGANQRLRQIRILQSGEGFTSWVTEREGLLRLAAEVGPTDATDV